MVNSLFECSVNLKLFLKSSMETQTTAGGILGRTVRQRLSQHG